MKTDKEKSDVFQAKQKNTHVNGFSDSLKPNGVVNGKVQQNGMMEKRNEENGSINGIVKNGFKNNVGANGVIRNRSDKKKLNNGFTQPNGLNKSFGSKNEMMNRTDENHNPRLDSSGCWSQSLKNWVTGHQENDDEEETQSTGQHIKVKSSIKHINVRSSIKLRF